MRPGQSCPGVVGGGGRVDCLGLSFNEAGAIMPRSGSGSPSISTSGTLELQ